MKIEIIKAYAGSPKYDILYSTFWKMFSQKGIHVVNSGECPDCRLVLGNRIESALQELSRDGIPCIRTVFRSDIAMNFAIDESVVDFTFIVKDLDINILCPYRQTTAEIPVPFIFDDIEKQTDTEYAYDIYVNTGEFLYSDSALFKILRTLNRFTRYKIDVCTRNENLKAIVNGNITLSDSSSDIEEHVRRSRIVIGSGYAVLYALKYHKPFVVVGERGYGGIPKDVNILSFYHGFFQGCIGGRLDGPLPENLVSEDVNNLMSSQFDVSLLRKKVSGCVSDVCDRIVDCIEKIVADSRDISLPLQFNTDYTVIEGNGKYWLLNRFTRFIISRLEKNEVEIINEFLHPQCCLYDELSDEKKKVVKRFVMEKILIKRR